MFIVWGKRLRRKNLGIAATFCEICRRPRIGRLTSRHLARHVYYVPITKGDRLPDEWRCDACDVRHAFDPMTVKPIEPGPSSALDVALMTGPMSKRDLARRLKLEKAVRTGKIPDGERISLIMQPFLALDHEFERRFGGGQESLNAVLQLTFIVVGIAAAVLWYNYATALPQESPSPTWAVTTTALSVGMLVVLLIRLRRTPRVVARSLLRLLVPALAPITPRADELDIALRRLAAQGSALAQASSSAEIMKRLRRADPVDIRREGRPEDA